MKNIKITRERIRCSILNKNLNDRERQGWVRNGAVEDSDSFWDGGWRVASAEIISVVPHPDNHKYPGYSQMDRVYALITETKIVSVPETTEEVAK